MKKIFFVLVSTLLTLKILAAESTDRSTAESDTILEKLRKHPERIAPEDIKTLMKCSDSSFRTVQMDPEYNKKIVHDYAVTRNDSQKKYYYEFHAAYPITKLLGTPFSWGLLSSIQDLLTKPTIQSLINKNLKPEQKYLVFNSCSGKKTNIIYVINIDLQDGVNKFYPFWVQYMAQTSSKNDGELISKEAERRKKDALLSLSNRNTTNDDEKIFTALFPDRLSGDFSEIRVMLDAQDNETGKQLNQNREASSSSDTLQQTQVVRQPTTIRPSVVDRFPTALPVPTAAPSTAGTSSVVQGATASSSSNTRRPFKRVESHQPTRARTQSISVSPPDDLLSTSAPSSPSPLSTGTTDLGRMSSSTSPISSRGRIQLSSIPESNPEISFSSQNNSFSTSPSSASPLSAGGLDGTSLSSSPTSSPSFPSRPHSTGAIEFRRIKSKKEVSVDSPSSSSEGFNPKFQKALSKKVKEQAKEKKSEKKSSK